MRTVGMRIPVRIGVAPGSRGLVARIAAAFEPIRLVVPAEEIRVASWVDGFGVAAESARWCRAMLRAEVIYRVVDRIGHLATGPGAPFLGPSVQARKLVFDKPLVQMSAIFGQRAGIGVRIPR